jgi:hypothetical protein
MTPRILLASSLALLCLAAPAGATIYDFTASGIVPTVGAPPDAWLGTITGTLDVEPDPATAHTDYTGTQWLDWHGSLTLSNGTTHSGVIVMVTYIDSPMVRYAMNTGPVNLYLDIYYGALGFTAWNNTGGTQPSWRVDTPWLDGAWRERPATQAVPEVAPTLALLAGVLLCLSCVRHRVSAMELP